MTAVLGGPDVVLTPAEVEDFVAGALQEVDGPVGAAGRAGRHPDRTRPAGLRRGRTGARRAGPADACWSRSARTSRWTTRRSAGCSASRSTALRAAGTQVLNHAWHDPATFADLGTIPADEVSSLSGGLLAQDVPVRVNRLALEHDLVLIAGPVFPHEVVGFSGGNKYLFPGIGGQEIIDLSHWLGALISSVEIIGTLGTTPVRALIDRAAALVPTPRRCLALVVTTGRPELHAVCWGTPEQAWAAAAPISAQVHVTRLDRAYDRVVAVLPDMYADVWTAAKGMYKLEPVVADGGELLLYAPHVRDFSVTHGAQLAEVGYHCRDYFLGQWERFRHHPGGVLAHSTHLRGAGTWDPVQGERPRVRVVLATGIAEERVRAHALEHRDPATVDLDAARADPDVLVVERAGEVLHRLA